MLDSLSLSISKIMSWSLHPPKFTSEDFHFKDHHELIDLNKSDAFQSTDIC